MVASGRTRRLVISCVFCVKWVRSGVGGWGGGGYVHVHWTCTLTWCYATARSLQFTQLRDATLLHVLFNLHNYVVLRYCTFSSINTSSQKSEDFGGVRGESISATSLFPICVEMYSPNLYTTGHAERAGKVGEKQRRRQLLKELKRDVLMQKRYKNARRLTRPRPGWLVVWNMFFHNMLDNPSHWLIFFKMVKTTNQYLSRTSRVLLRFVAPKWPTGVDHREAYHSSGQIPEGFNAQRCSRIAQNPCRIVSTSLCYSIRQCGFDQLCWDARVNAV